MAPANPPTGAGQGPLHQPPTPDRRHPGTQERGDAPPDRRHPGTPGGWRHRPLPARRLGVKQPQPRPRRRRSM
eukprot:5949975-Alexandrium_andersonii.AAC.1